MSEQLKVYYPHGGPHFLLYWWTYNERGHVILSRTEGGIEPAIMRVSKEHTDAEIRAFMEIDIVAPSKAQCELAAAFALKDRIAAFHHEVIWRLREVIKSKKPLPSQFVLCTKYETDEDDAVNKDEWANETHYSCKNCYETIRLVDMTKEELYAKYHEAWEKLFPLKRYVDPKRVLSRATPAKDDEELYFADAVFGHHCSGIELNPVDRTISLADYWPAHLTSHLLFLFRKTRDLDAKKFQSILERQQRAREDFRKQTEKARVARQKKEERAQIEAVLSFFGSEMVARSALIETLKKPAALFIDTLKKKMEEGSS